MSESLSQKYERILSMLEVGKRHGCYTQIRCPVAANHKHGDKAMSASLGLHSNGISFKCFAGCQTDDFLKELGLTYKDFYPDNERTLPLNTYTYYNADGSYHHDKVKFPDPLRKKTFKQRTIDENGKVSYTAVGGIPFAYPQLIEAIKADKVVLYTEGEKDALTARLLSYDSTTMGGASDWKDEYKNYFKDAKLILIPDKDDPGLKLTGKMVESLKPVVKSLRILVLPVGKDLTEWVEAGNSDLRPLIENATELITTKDVPEPVVKTIVGGFELYWIGMDLKVTIDHIENDDSVEIAVYENNKPIYISGYKLLSITHKQSLAGALKKVSNSNKWDMIVNQITVQCLSRIRAGEPIIWLNSKLGMEKPKHLVFPLFVERNPNIIYGERSSAKSLFMTLIAILLSCEWGERPYGLTIPNLHKVLFLDWENDPTVVGWVKECLLRGFGEDYIDLDIPYLHCTRPLAKCLPEIQQKINEVGADIAIMDSLGLAVGGNLNDTEPAINFFNATRQLPVTPLIIAHNAKDKENKFKTVFGSVFYENLSRSIWEVNKYQEQGAKELTLSMFQRKAPPFSGYSEPLGFRFTFEGDRIYVSDCQAQADKRLEEK